MVVEAQPLKLLSFFENPVAAEVTGSFSKELRASRRLPSEMNGNNYCRLCNVTLVDSRPVAVAFKVMPPGSRSRLQNGQAAAFKRPVRVALAIFAVVQIAVADAKDFCRAGQIKFYLRFRIGNAHAIFIHNPEFNVADILAVGAKFRHVGQQFNPACRSRRFQSVIANVLSVRAANGLERSRLERNLPVQNAVDGFGKIFGSDDFAVQRQGDFGAVGEAADGDG